MAATAAHSRWLVLLLALTGCVHQGAIAGRLEAPGSQPKPITMNFESNRFSGGGKINTELPSGEYFNGRYLQITEDMSTDTFGPGWMGWGPWAPGWGDWGGGVDYATFVKNYSGKVIATLFGDRKNTMRCRFELANPADGMSGGGVGECQVTNGDTIQAQF